ncbi:DNA-binding transcriptional LysR family regulator [Paraburkholderia sp. GAS199]|uniref:LysR family transcriptional regulator n=1 Tax=Paraburkholderia sp. GAS199 TaxID=3035126 RepID=UPI003D19C4BE
MDHLNAIRLFILVADIGSFASAARAMRISTSVATRHVTFLEERLATRLFHRDTRKVTLTDSGAIYLERIRHIVDSVDSLDNIFDSANLEPAGALRIVAPVAFGSCALGPVIESYCKQFPRVSTDITLDDRGVDLVQDGFDVGIFVGHEIHSETLIARTLLSGRLVVCATPEYVAEHGAPLDRSGLSEHQCLVTSQGSTGVARYLAGAADIFHTKPKDIVVSNNLEMLRQLALRHLGLAILPDYLVQHDIAQNRLVEIAGDFDLDKVEIKVGYASRKHLSSKIRAFVDHAARHFGQQTGLRA